MKISSETLRETKGRGIRDPFDDIVRYLTHSKLCGVKIYWPTSFGHGTSNFSLEGEGSVKDSQTNIDVKEIKVLDPWWRGKEGTL